MLFSDLVPCSFCKRESGRTADLPVLDFDLVIEARYNGSFAGGYWLCFPEGLRLDGAAWCGEAHCAGYWSTAESNVVGRGVSADDACADRDMRARVNN